MNILHDHTDYATETETLAITRVEYVEAYKLHLWFRNEHQYIKDHIVDFAPFLLNTRNPMTTKYPDMALFRDFTLEHGNLHWNDYEMCFETASLLNATTVEYNGFG